MPNFKELAQQIAPYIIERRRHYHAHPELPGQEAATCRAIAEDLEALGIAVTQVDTCHGLIGTLQGSRPGKTVALRADTDALALTEQTGYDFASRTPGVMHACGHDAHIAMLLGAAKLLAQHRESLCGTVRFLIQPEEESATGAKNMIAAGALEGVDAVYGAHVWDALESPLIDVSPGPRMAGCDKFTIRVLGRSAHGAAPHQGVDAIVAAAAIVQNLQTIVAREANPLDALVVTVGTIHGGKAFNIIANQVVLEGTVRYFFAAKQPEDLIRRVAEHTAAAHGAAAELNYLRSHPPVINGDDTLNRIARNAVTSLYGEAGLGRMAPTMSSEDFSVYRKHVPTLFAFVGSHNEEKGLIHPNHHEKYSADEDALHRGAAVMAQFATDYLAQA